MPSTPSTPAPGSGTASPTRPTASAAPAPLQARLLRLARHPQFAWFIGHVLTVAGLPLYLLAGSLGAYYRALLGAVVAYGVVLFRQYSPLARTQGVAACAQRVVVDLNAHYLALAAFFWLGYPCIALLVPFWAFSIFHCMGYIRDVLLPAIFVRTPTTAQPPVVTKITATLSALSQRYQPQTLLLAGYWEITATPLYLILQVLTLKQSLVAPLVYAQFLSVRYLTSSSTRTAFTHVRHWLDARVLPLQQQPGIFSKIAGAYIWVRDKLSAYAESRMRAGQPPQQQQHTHAQ